MFTATLSGGDDIPYQIVPKEYFIVAQNVLDAGVNIMQLSSVHHMLEFNGNAYFNKFIVGSDLGSYACLVFKLSPDNKKNYNQIPLWVLLNKVLCA